MESRKGKAAAVGFIPLIVIAAAFGAYLSTSLGSNGSSSSDLTTFTRYCTGYPIFCGITSATWSTGSTTTVVVFQFANSSRTSYYTLTLSHIPQIYSTDSTTTEVVVLYSNSNTTSYYTEILYHVALNYSTTYTVTNANTTTAVYANLGGASTPRFELQDFSLSAYNSLIRASYLYGLVVFNSTMIPPTSIQFLVNGTGGDPQPISMPSNVPRGQTFADLWKSGAGYNLISGHAYMITFIVTYEDDVTQSESIVLIAY